MTRLVVTFSLLLTLAPARAWACSCGSPVVQRIVIPTDGATDFPTDGMIRVLLGAYPDAARRAIGSEYRLRDASGAVVTLDATISGTRLDLRPHARLSPSTTYTLEQVFAFDASGTRLSDLERMDSHGPLRGIWYPVQTLRTGSGAAIPRAVAPTITATQLHFAHGGGDCGPATSVRADVALPPGALPTDIVELRVRSMGMVTSEPAIGLSYLYAGDMLCDPDPVTLPAAGTSIEIQLALVDIAGTTLGTSAWTTSSGRGRRSASPGRTGYSAGGSWPGVTITTAPSAIAARGPASCTHGLEVVSRHDTVSANAPWAYGDRSTIATEGAARWLAYAGGDGAPMELFRVAGDGATSRVATSMLGYPNAALASGTGVIASFVTYSQDAHALGHVARFDAHGATLWSADLSGNVSDLRIAHGGGRVLVAWPERAADYSEHLAWGVFDEASGAAIAGPRVTTLGLDSNAEGPAAAFVDGNFMIVSPTASGFRRGPLTSSVIRGTTLGPPTDLSAIDTYSPPDLVGAGTRAGLVTADQSGRVLFTVLDHDGGIEAGPFEASTGVGGRENRLPRIAWNGSVFAIGWETNPTPGVWIAIGDTTGAMSSAIRIDANEPSAGTIGVAPTANGWLAAYTIENGRGRTAELRCRTAAPLGPPQRIGAVP